MKFFPSCIAILFLLFACNSPKEKKKAEASDSTVISFVDPHTLSNANDVRVQHLDLDIKIDFDKREITGVANWTIKNLKRADGIIFDTKNLFIDSVKNGTSIQN